MSPEQRETADTVALILAITVAIVVVGSAAVILASAALSPGQDSASGAEAIGRIVSVLVGALVGYMAGRRVRGE